MAIKAVVLGFTDQQTPLEPLWPTTHRAMLPVAGKPLVVHAIEQLSATGVRHVRVAAGVQQSAVRQRLADGSEWGVCLRYSDLCTNDLVLQTLMEFGQCLSITGDELHLFGPGIAKLDRKAVALDSDRTFSSVGGWHLESSMIMSEQWDNRHDYQRIDIHSVADYHAANLAAADGRFPTLTMPGRQCGRQIVDWKTQLGKGVELGERVVIGKHCHLGTRSKLESDCILSNGVVMGPDCHLYNVVVLPNTQLAEGLRLRDAVVGPNGIFDLGGRYWDARGRGLVEPSRDSQVEKTGLPGEVSL